MVINFYNKDDLRSDKIAIAKKKSINKVAKYRS